MRMDKIIERIYIKGNLSLQSPVIMGCGEDAKTDNDLIRDWDDQPFIPGTSLAGVIRHYLNNYIADKSIVDTYFGQHGKNAELSVFLFYDALVYEAMPELTVRDGLELNRLTKTSINESKYNYEILEPGQHFNFKLEVVIREKNKDNINEIYDMLHAIVSSLKHEKVTIGAKVHRGFGKVKLVDEKIVHLRMDAEKYAHDIESWINFDWETSFKEPATLDDFKTDEIIFNENPWDTISVTFTIPYSILIRHYLTGPNEPDAVQLTLKNGKPVIPGTSWNGALRHGIYRVLQAMGKENKFDTINNELFGYVDKKTRKACASRILLEESEIKDGAFLNYTRNRIDRFSGGVVQGGLIDERPYFHGQTTLNIKIRKKQNDKYKGWDIALIKLALQDMTNGIQPVGGDTNIGRGILQADKISIEKDYLQALANKLTKEA